MSKRQATDARRTRPVGPLLLALATAACGGSPGSAPTPSAAPGDPDAAATSTAGTRPGIDVLLADSSHLIEGRRLGLITHASGVGRDGRRSADLLHARVGSRLVRLFSPEHGLGGDRGEGEQVGDAIDARTGLAVFSLYGGTRGPTRDMLEGIDLLLFDLQDVGARYYTYVSTMALSMEAAGEAGIPFVVLDRPNPVGAPVQGPVLDPAYASFVGLYPIPARHGMTVGELARLFVGAFGIDVDLRVVPVAGWRRETWFDETGLPWIPPSLNMPELESAAHYPGTCLFEGTGLSVGRGTERAFQQLGAPWLDGQAWAGRLRAHRLPGVDIEAVTFTPDRPSDGKFDGVPLSGIRLRVTDRAAYDPVATAVTALGAARALAGDRWTWRAEHFDRLAGSSALREAIEARVAPAEIAAGWRTALADFTARRAPYLLYP